MDKNVVVIQARVPTDLAKKLHDLKEKSGQPINWQIVSALKQWFKN